MKAGIIPGLFRCRRKPAFDIHQVTKAITT
jgi:hypothetical protein